MTARVEIRQKLRKCCNFLGFPGGAERRHHGEGHQNHDSKEISGQGEILN
jgi:hypothetical protein